MAREHREIVCAADIGAEPVPGEGWPPGAELKRLSHDRETGAVSGVMSLPAGYRRGAGAQPPGSELFVLSGSVRIGASVRSTGFYEYTPAEAAQEPWVTEDDCELLFLSRGTPDFAPGAGSADNSGCIRLDTTRMPWVAGKVPGPPPGLFSKVLRHSRESGERVFLCACVRRYDYPLVEYHDCSEECYQISGDMRMGTSGLMQPGSYFWRPPYISHGPFYSRGGMVALMTVDGPLLNHYVENPRRTAEENRAEALTEGPPRDYFAESLNA